MGTRKYTPQEIRRSLSPPHLRQIQISRAPLVAAQEVLDVVKDLCGDGRTSCIADRWIDVRRVRAKNAALAMIKHPPSMFEVLLGTLRISTLQFQWTPWQSEHWPALTHQSPGRRNQTACVCPAPNLPSVFGAVCESGFVYS